MTSDIKCETRPALLAPRKLLFLNPVDGRRRYLTTGATRRHFKFSESVYRIHDAGQKLSRRITDPLEAPAELVEWLTAK